MGRRSRKRKPSAVGKPSTTLKGPGPSRGVEGYSRSRAKDDAVRASLEPLPQGERPGAVTVAAIVSFFMGIANAIAALAGESLGSEATSFTVFSTLLLLGCAGGMWFGARYWAVLGFMMILAFQILSLALAVLRVERWWVGLIVVVVLGLLGTLFYKLIRALSRIQMPERPQPRPR